jgi:hypothetical protein
MVKNFTCFIFIVHFFEEKQLRDEAAAEVACVCLFQEDIVKGSRRRKGMDTLEKIQDSRDRNREHAKNTRLRKKAYVIKLKELAEKLEKQKCDEDAERQMLGIAIKNKEITKKNVIRLFFSYRENNLQDRSFWEKILDENFVFTLPITPYRSFLKRDIISGSRVLVGIDAGFHIAFFPFFPFMYVKMSS